MRLHVFTIACMLLASTATMMAQDEAKTDTLLMLVNAKDVKVTNGNGTITVDVGHTKQGNTYRFTATSEPVDTIMRDWNVVNLPFLKAKNNRFQTLVYPCISYELGWLKGFDYPLNDKLSQSALIEVCDFIWNLGWTTNFGISLGFRYDQYAFGGPNMLQRERFGALAATSVPECAYDIRSEINNFGLIIPLRFNQTIYRSIGFSIGATLNFNTYTTAKGSYKIADEKFQTKYKGLHQRLFTADYFAAINFSCFAVYAKYVPGGLFKADYGPNFKQWKVGISWKLK